jgi:hypothetical protein
MTPLHFATLLSQHRKVAIAGGPKTGKSTLVIDHRALHGDGLRRPLFCTDDIEAKWEDVPAIALEKLANYQAWVIEGVQVGRCLRKGLRPDAVIYLKKAHIPLSKGQKAMEKGCRTIYEEWLEVVQRTEQFESVDMHDDYEVVTLRWRAEE